MHEVNTKHWPRVVDIPPFPSDVQTKSYPLLGPRQEWIESPTLHPPSPTPHLGFVMAIIGYYGCVVAGVLNAIHHPRRLA